MRTVPTLATLLGFVVSIGGSVFVDDEASAATRKWPAACKQSLDFAHPDHTGADGEPDDVVTRHFDTAGRVSSEDWWRREPHVPDRTNTMSYDDQGRLEREELRVVEDGRLVRITSYEYDSEGRLAATGTDEDCDGKQDWRDELVYDAAGRVVTAREQVEVATGRVLIVKTYRHDTRGNLVEEDVDTGEAGSPNWRHSYRYDERDRQIEKTTHWFKPGYTDEVTTYEYDASDRLILETKKGWTTSYEYDEYGNLLAEEYRLPKQDFLSTRTEYDYSCWE